MEVLSNSLEYPLHLKHFLSSPVIFELCVFLFSDQGTTVCRTAVLGAGAIFLFASRACYNLTALILSQSHRVESFNFDWYNVSDQVNISSPHFSAGSPQQYIHYQTFK